MIDYFGQLLRGVPHVCRFVESFVETDLVLFFFQLYTWRLAYFFPLFLFSLVHGWR